MQGSETAHIFLSDSHQTLIKQNINASINNVFLTMFNTTLEPSLCDASKPDDSLSAHVFLSHEKINLGLCISISHEAADFIAESIHIDKKSALYPTVLQDIPCEVANMVGNNLRTCLAQNGGVYFGFYSPLAGNINSILHPSLLFDMNFQIPQTGKISLSVFTIDGIEIEMDSKSKETHNSLSG